MVSWKILLHQWIKINSITNDTIAELARQQEAEARKQQEEEEATASESHSVVEDASEGPQSAKYAENDEVENTDDIIINHDTVDATDDEAPSDVDEHEAESSKYESEEETE